MKQITKQNGITLISLLLALPTAYFFVIAVLKYELSVDGPFDAIAPLLERWGIKEALGWNINLLIVFGPAIAICICLAQLLQIKWDISGDRFNVNVTVMKKWFPISVVLLSGLVLTTLFFYMLGENCNCHG